MIERYSRLVEKYRTVLTNMVYGKTKDYCLSQDIYQDACIKAWLKIDKFSGTDIEFRNWLSRICINLFIDHYRVNKAIMVRDTDNYSIVDYLDTKQIAADDAVFEERTEHLHVFLKQLPPEQQHVIRRTATKLFIDYKAQIEAAA